MPESAPVTDWPLRILLVLGMLAILLMVFYFMRRRWKNMTIASEVELPPIVQFPPESFAPLVTVPGLFLGTSPANNWMLRVMAEGLGVRSRATCQWSTEGVFFQREGASDVFIDMNAILGSGFGRGVAGTVRAKDSVLMIRWLLGEAILESGFRADTSEGHQFLMEFNHHVEQKLGHSS